MPSIYDIETLLFEHMQITSIWLELIMIICFPLNYYLSHDKRSAMNELVLFAGFLYVETSYMTHHPEHDIYLLRMALVLHCVVGIYTTVRQPAPHHNFKLLVVTTINLAACFFSFECAPRVEDHAFSAMWHSENWQRKLEFLQECKGAPYVYFMHTLPQVAKTRFLDPNFIEQWLVTVHLMVVGVILVLVTLIFQVASGRDNIETQNKTLQATILEHKDTAKDTAKKYDKTIKELHAGWNLTLEKNIALTERIAVLQIEVAEAAARIAVLQTEITQAAVRVPHP